MAATFWLLLFFASFHVVSSITDQADVTVLQSLRAQWQNTPPSWGTSNDPCGQSSGSAWDGITCNSNSRVIALGLSSLGIKGRISADIGGLSELRSLDLSQNRDLTGSLSAGLGNLLKLSTLILAGCGFTGNIPDELGNLSELTFIALNSNNFTGPIPATLGKLTNLYWLDLADNQLSGPLPVSSATSSGLDLLLKAKHFHLNNNKFTDSIPPKLFSSAMTLIHLLLDGNELSGSIPSSLGLVQTLEVVRLDRNLLMGGVPTNINNLTNVNELHIANNQLSGLIPDLTGMNSLSYVDLSNNSFSPSDVPAWLSTLQSLTTLVIEYGPLRGTLPEKLFGFPMIQQVKLKNNSLNGTLNMGNSISQQLQLVDLENNKIELVTLGSTLKNNLILIGNPVCSSTLANTAYCQLQQSNAQSYSTSLATCGSKTCPTDQKLDPQSCACAFPYEGVLEFRAPSFRELSNVTRFHSLESSLSSKLAPTAGAVYLQNPFFNSDDYLLVSVSLFPPTELYFSRSEISKVGFQLTNQTYKPPAEFGPYVFIASPYAFQVHSGTSVSIGMIVGIAVGCAVLVLVLVGVGIYAFRQKKRAEKAIEFGKPFASWAPTSKDSGGAPQLKGARWFSFDEIKKCTNNFAVSNEIGSGGYGKVYKGMLVEGTIVAIKRAQQGSLQGGPEFRNEIELLSRVHHKNLVSLIGFCFEQGEQMLVYEFMPNGTLQESLSGKTGILLDWKRRLRLALGSAKGLAYLHELADPPIIHRDIKTTNILLDENLVAKVADFGLSKLVSDSEKGHVSTQVKGTLGYLDPEYFMTNQLTEKSDVYSFGVVMLELITAMQPISKGKYIVRVIRTSLDKTDEQYLGITELIDPVIRNSGNLAGFLRFLELALQCVEESGDARPSMNEVVKTIETILQNDGMNSNNTSAPTSSTDFLNGNSDGVFRHPYSNEALPLNYDLDSDAFDYSGGYNLSTKVVPK